MAPRKPSSGNMFNRKKEEIKKKISAEKGKDKSDKDRLAALEAMLAELMAKTQQDKQGGKAISDADVKRTAGRFYENALSDEQIARMKRNIEKNRPETKGNMKLNYPGNRKKGGGKVYASQNKKYGGGIYPKRGK